ncbi:MAG TPA: tripartite tricarboxylate transporter substrate binding protein [Alphaproteobacteria bacterium]
MTTRRGRGLRLVAVALAGLAAASAAGAQTYPARPVRLLVGFPPGGGADMIARQLSPRLSQELGQSFVVDNHPGANGRIGADMTAKAPPDGYTLLVSTEGALVIGPHIAQKPSYDALQDFTPVTLLSRTAVILAANPSLPVRSLGDLLALAKAKPGSLFYGSSGFGGPNHLAGEVFKKQAGVEIEHVAYKGTGAVIPALLSGQVQLMFGFVPGLAPFVKSGDMTALGVGSSKRSAALPEVPTIDEAGVPGYDMTSWIGVLAPARTPPEIVRRLRDTMAAILLTPEIRDGLIRDGLEPIASTPEEFAAFLHREDAKYAGLLAGLDIKE